MINWSKWHELRESWLDQLRALVEGWMLCGYWTSEGFKPTRGNGDFAFDNARWMIEYPNDVNIKESNLDVLFNTLAEGKRWPDYMDKYITTTNHTQFQVTRDPWIMVGCAAVDRNRYDLIEKFTPPFKWGPYREWWKAINGKKNYYKLWRWLPLIIFVKHTYIFWGFMEIAYLKVKEKNG